MGARAAAAAVAAGGGGQGEECATLASAYYNSSIGPAGLRGPILGAPPAAAVLAVLNCIARLSELSSAYRACGHERRHWLVVFA